MTFQWTSVYIHAVEHAHIVGAVWPAICTIVSTPLLYILSFHELLLCAELVPLEQRSYLIYR